MNFIKTDKHKQPNAPKEDNLNKEEEMTSTLVNNFEQLILSTDLVNMQVGLEMIKRSDLPQPLIDRLLLIQKTTTNKEIQKAIQSTLKKKLAAEWKALVSDDLSFKTIYSPHASSLYILNRFATLARNTTPTLAAQFSFLVFQKTGRGLRYALTAELPKAIKMEAYQLLLDHHHFDFSKGLNYKERPVTNIHNRYNFSESSVDLPTLALELDTIYSLNLSNCRYNSLEKAITLFKDLKHVDLSINELSSLPDYLLELQSLESINLQDNYIEEFPDVLADLPDLKQINLLGNPCSEIPVSFLRKKQNCEVIINHK